MGSYLSKKTQSDTSESSEDDYDNSSEMESDKDMTADAAVSGNESSERQRIFPLYSMTPNQVVEIERSLETYEKISLTYLLYDDPHISLQNVGMLIQDKNYNLMDWVKHEQSLIGKKNKWEYKLLEALGIIQNYEILKKLGYNKSEIYNRFLPLTKTKSLFVNPIRKCLYRMCEDFTEANSKNFLKYAKNDLKNLPDFGSEEIYMEMYLLYFETEKYICCKMPDLRNVIKICKYMDLDNLENDLKVFLPSRIIKPKPGRSNSLGDEQFDVEDYLNIDKTPGLLSNSKPPVETQKSKTSPSDVNISPVLGKEKYDIDPNNPGILIIINNEFFYSEYREHLRDLVAFDQQLDQRDGSNEDEEILKKTFEKFNFKVICFKDLDHHNMLTEIKNIVSKINNESSLFIAILSHGKEGIVYGSNSIGVEITKIKVIMCCQALAGKPKVLILQSCRGNEVQELNKSDDLTTDGPSNRSYSVPKTADLLVFCATVPGYAAIRHKKKGSWFIQSLCKTMEGKHACHFQDICVFVQREVTNERWKQKVMVPIMESTFSKFLYLPDLKPIDDVS